MSIRTALLAVGLLMAAACGDDQCLVEPGCGSQVVVQQTPPPPVPAVLAIASFSVVETQVPGDYFCESYCLTPFVHIVETTGLGRAQIKSVTVFGYELSGAARWCPVEPGQQVTITLIEDAWIGASSMGQERTILVTYDDGVGGVATVSARTLVASSAPAIAVRGASNCNFTSAKPVQSLRSTSR